MKPKDFNVGDWVYLSIKYLKSRKPLKKTGPKYVEPFPIKGLVNPVSVELRLDKSLRNIDLIFHCSLLKPELLSPLYPLPPPPPESLMIEGEQHFVVKDILDSHKHHGKIQYLMVWKDFPSSKMKWVDLKHVKGIKLLKHFHNQYSDKSKGFCLFFLFLFFCKTNILVKGVAFQDLHHQPGALLGS